ncbi:nicotinamide riboside kinase 1 [Scaptodrosophila lebanonensis]|uniref:Nicotinamide riboside kinase 1 n=1 Tax=Drosophila lebanonensis TaxID=7225 RepID=A0A6J2UEU7_DROLE|nr:nicotinamide riboside kinase 1 [Scaptodrosophila lebanonensis]
MPQWLVIGISGVTCGGKTTLAQSLRDYFKGLRGAPLWNTPYTIGDVQLVSQDDYFLPVEDRRHKWNEKLNAINFELITSLDMKQMLADIAHIIKGRHLVPEPTEQLVEYMPATTAVTYANFEHYAMQFQQQYQQQYSNYQHNSNGKLGYQYQPPQHHQQHPHQHRQHHHHPHHQQQQQQQQQQQAAHIMRVNAQIAAQMRDKKINVLLIEGFMIFNQPELLALCNLKYHFHLPYEKCYERRRKRTYDPPDVTGYFELCVWPHYELNFSEYRDCKDITFLNGEISKEKIFKFVLQRIVHYFEERCDGNMPSASNNCPPPQKLFGMLGVTMSTANNNLMPKTCPMEQ